MVLESLLDPAVISCVSECTDAAENLQSYTAEDSINPYGVSPDNPVWGRLDPDTFGYSYEPGSRWDLESRFGGRFGADEGAYYRRDLDIGARDGDLEIGVFESDSSEHRFRAHGVPDSGDEDYAGFRFRLRGDRD